MEKGSFHGTPTAQPNVKSDELIKNIPLPNQLPRTMDFAEIPPNAVKSATLETLIGQNEDLMARLSVNLRKYAQLEEVCAVLERDNTTFQNKFEALREQFLVLKEKDAISAARQAQLTEEAAVARAQLQRLEKIYAELYVQAQAIQRRLVHLERYRVRMNKAKASVQARAKKVTHLESECARLTDDFDHLKRSLSAATTQTVNAYETKLGEARQAVEELKTKAAERDSLFEAKVKVENQLLFEQRQMQMRCEDAQTEIDRLATQNGNLRVELKETLLLNEAQKQQVSKLSQDVPLLEEETQHLREQIESLQVLWAQKQRELDQAEGKNRALQKLNQSLSLNLNSQRKELNAVKSDTEKDGFTAQEKIKTLVAEIQELRRQINDDDGTSKL